MTYINGGHVPPLLVNSQGLKETLLPTGSAVGAYLDAKHSIRETTIQPGDILFAYTDGLTDASNLAGEDFHEEELLPLLTGTGDARTLLANVQRRLADFTDCSACLDDVTLLAVKRLQK